jgi:hypothetical protein
MGMAAAAVVAVNGQRYEAAGGVDQSTSLLEFL